MPCQEDTPRKGRVLMGSFEKGISFDSRSFNNQIKALMKAYGKLSPTMQKNTIKRGFQKMVSTDKMVRVFRSHVPVGDDTTTWEGSKYQPEGMKKSVGTKVYWHRGRREWICKVGLMRSKAKRGYYGIMNERGTKLRFVGAGRNSRKGKGVTRAASAYKAGGLRCVGAISAKPFKARAVSATRAACSGN